MLHRREPVEPEEADAPEVDLSDVLQDVKHEAPLARERAQGPAR